MKITIDTAVDTHEDMRKVVTLLAQILAKKDQPQESVEEMNSATSAGFANMFGSASQQEESFDKTTKTTAGTAPNFGSFLGLVDKKEEEPKEEKPQLQFY